MEVGLLVVNYGKLTVHDPLPAAVNPVIKVDTQHISCEENNIENICLQG